MIYKINDFAKKIGVSRRTLIRWDKSGKLIAYRMPNGYRFYTEEQYEEFMKNAKIKNNENIGE